MNCGVGHRSSSDPMLLWPDVMVAPALIGPLAWEPPYAESSALKKKNQKTKQLIAGICLNVSQSKNNHHHNKKLVSSYASVCDSMSCTVLCSSENNSTAAIHH